MEVWVSSGLPHELAHGLHFINFGHYVLPVTQKGMGLAILTQAWAQDPWDPPDQRLCRQRGVTLSQLLDQVK